MVKNKITTSANQIEEEKNKRRERQKRGNSRGLFFFVILYVLRNYSTKEHPLKVSKINELVQNILGYAPDSDSDIISEKAIRDYLHIITDVEIPVDTADFRLINRRVIEEIKKVDGVIKVRVVK